ncbi:c-type cytochrome [Acidiphilium acidophilum]|uniref:c-type cytochrome n=1 Tax=Acidiphilium acidophilum TaxID=76588 RepID=UPI002E8E6B4F|nr:c-type cytochrome [Acidiphilium acidophilum]
MSTNPHAPGPGKKGRDPLLLNKIAGGILSAGLVAWIVIQAPGILSGKDAAKTRAEVAKNAPATAAAAGGGVPSIDPLIIKADVSKGQQFVAQQCAACHTVDKGGANGVGPNLYGVMNDKMFAKAGYDFSSAVKSKASGVWTYQKMNEWLVDPQKFAPGTRMGYTGIKNDVQRADTIAYLRTLSTDPIPLPKPGQGAAATSAVAMIGPSSGAPAIAPLYASAVAGKGQSFFEQQCSACHTITKGGANGVGPNLYGIVGAPMFAKAGYTFSGAVKKAASGNWTPHKLNEWLYDPMKDVPGTHMAYPGVKNNQVRADLIDYLNTQSASPEKLPTTSASATPAAAATQTASAGLDTGAPTIKPVLASAVIAKGQSFFEQQCSACHSIDKGGANGVGPNLYGVVGAPMFAKAGYSFSSGAKKAAADGKWTPHELNEWLYDPVKAVPGTHMAYPGIKNTQVRADVIAYLNAQSATPETLK